MMTLFLIGSVGAMVILGGVPAVLYGLMLETCRERAANATAVGSTSAATSPVRVELTVARAA